MSINQHRGYAFAKKHRAVNGVQGLVLCTFPYETAGAVIDMIDAGVDFNNPDPDTDEGYEHALVAEALYRHAGRPRPPNVNIRLANRPTEFKPEVRCYYCAGMVSKNKAPIEAYMAARDAQIDGQGQDRGKFAGNVERDLELARDNKIEMGSVILWPQDEEPSPPSSAAAQLQIATLLRQLSRTSMPCWLSEQVCTRLY